jgi:hypothetical protein
MQRYTAYFIWKLFYMIWVVPPYDQDEGCRDPYRILDGDTIFETFPLGNP